MTQDLSDNDFSKIDFYELEPDPMAMVRHDINMDFVSAEDITGSINLLCGELVSYIIVDDECEIAKPPVFFKISAEQFDILFRKIELRDLPKGYEYQSYEEFSLDIGLGVPLQLHDFERNLCLQAVIAREAETGELVAMMAVASEHIGEENPGKTLAYNRIKYRMEEYGSTWAAIVNLDALEGDGQ